MHRLDQLFASKKNGVLSVYFTAGFPQLNDSVRIMQALQEAGVDIIEVGIPFSDPVADGQTIQESNQTALNNGMTLKELFRQLTNIRQKVQIPVLFMGYINPILQFGIEKFCQECERIGVDGLILPDLPMQEYLDEYKNTFERYGLRNIFLITPQTSENRIRMIDNHTKGFIYMVSSASTTGAKQEISQKQLDYFTRVKKMNLKNPTLIGFGISNKETFDGACHYANGAIIGSAFIKVLAGSKNLEEDIKNFVKAVKGS
ncbi:MAG: tryptophan synthase subunit alpha [Flammeovirgaceae bacterium]